MSCLSREGGGRDGGRDEGRREGGREEREGEGTKSHPLQFVFLVSVCECRGGGWGGEVRGGGGRSVTGG